MPRVLFVHNGTPGRFGPLAAAMRGRGWSGALVSAVGGTDLPGLPTLRWRISPGAPLSANSLTRLTETDIRRGRAAAEACLRLKADGFRPDLVIGHPGWGEMLFVDQVFPEAPQIQIGELYYRTAQSHWNFDPEFAVGDFDRQASFRARNLTLAASYATAARIVCPTGFQASLLPPAFGAAVRVIHEGIDTAETRPRPQSPLQLAGAPAIAAGTPVVTFVNRRFEPMRGFHTFMRALPMLLDAVPAARAVLVGADDPDVYGPRPPAGGSWKRHMLDELAGRLDPGRVHFVGTLPYRQLLALLSLSTAHVYLTYPFVLSWSLLDAMACECLVVGSDTAPVREVVSNGINGLLVDFFDAEALARILIAACRDPAPYAPLRTAARETVVRRFDRRTICEPAWLALIDEVLAAG